MFQTRLVVAPILIVAVAVPLAISAYRHRRARYGVAWRLVAIVSVVFLGLHWATRPGLPTTLFYQSNMYFIGDEDFGTGPSGCPGIPWTLQRVGPARQVGYVGPISNHDGASEALVVQSGRFLGGKVLQPFSQVGHEDVMNFLLVERGNCIYRAQAPP